MLRGRRRCALGRHAMRVDGSLFRGRRSPSPTSSSSSGWSTTSEPTEGIVSIDHEAVHGSRLDSSKKQIRLLQILPRETPLAQGEHDPEEETVRCRMTKILLEDFDKQPPLFNALSYAWGNPNEQTNIVINGATTSVTTNLESALRHFRDCHTDVTRDFPLWVDAVSINQGDAEERNAQVSMMADIYRQADRVLCWLGEGDVDTDWLVPLLRDDKFRKEVEQSDLPTNFAPGMVIVRAVAIASQDLWRRCWWGRLWVTQEIMLAKRDPILVVGRETIAWSEYVLVFEHLRDIWGRIGTVSKQCDDAESKLFKTAHSHLPFISKYLYPGLYANISDDLRYDMQSQGHIALCKILVTADLFNKSATQRLDYVYALRGMLPKEEQRLIGVNYSRPSMQVFHDAMVVAWTSPYSEAWIGDVPRQLQYRRISTTGDAHGIPSWVPDLSAQGSIQGGIFTSFRDPWKAPKIQVSSDGKTLTLRGIYFDAVRDTRDVRFRMTNHDNVQYNEPQVRDLRQASLCLTAALGCGVSPSSVLYYLNGLSGRPDHTSRIMRIMVDLHRLHETPVHEELVHTMSAQLLTMDILETDSAVSILTKCAEQALKQRPTRLTADYYVQCFLRALGSRIQDNKVFTTEGGTIGVGPGHMETGDRIVFPFGMKDPFVVRPFDPEHPETHEYTMIGVAEVAELSDHRERLDKALEGGHFEEIDIHLK